MAKKTTKPTNKSGKPARAVCERPIRKRATAKPMTLATLDLTAEERAEIQEYLEWCRWLKSMSPAQYKMAQDMLNDAERMTAKGFSDLEIAAHLEHYYGAV
jgi:hypothetical protein